MKKDNIKIFFTIVLLIISFQSKQALSAFVGQNLQISHELSFYPVDNPWGEVQTVNVTNDNSDSIFIFNGITNEGYTIGYWVDFNDKSLEISWDFDKTRLYSGSYTAQSINGLHVYGVDTLLLENISNITFSATDFVFSNSLDRIFILPDENRMMFDFSGLNVNPSSKITFNFEITAVPLPSSIWLFGSGVLVLVSLYKRKNHG